MIGITYGEETPIFLLRKATSSHTVLKTDWGRSLVRRNDKNSNTQFHENYNNLVPHSFSI